MNLNDLPDMSDALKQVQMYEKKKLDPVGKEDGDIDNDGDKDSSDSYLLNRRKTVTKAMGKKTHLCAKMVKKEGKEYSVIPEQHTLLEDGTVTHYDITDGNVILENVPVEELEIIEEGHHEHFANYDKNQEVLGEGYGKKKKMKKEAFYFSDEEIADMVEIDEATDEELVDFFVEMIQELAEDEDDLLEICEHLEGVEMLAEASDKYYDSAVKSSKAAAKANRPSRRERMMSAAKKAGSAIKKGVKAAGKSVARNAGKAVGEFQAARIKQKRAAMSRPEKKKETSSSSSSSSSSDDDGTGGKLDALLSKTRGTSSSSSSSSGGGGSSSSGGKKKPGLLRRIGGAVKRGLKKAVGKTARAVSSGSGKLASRLGEDYDQIAHLYESGLFSIEEIENVIEEGYKEIDRSKENKMYRRAGNLARTGLSSKGKKKEDALNKSNKIVSAIARQKENERFKKMGDEKARSNYGG
tara:strand:+ start:2038 stop:3438 length:1401 start_codon:yes stop_codon:yes gene_type:complete